MIYIKTTKSKNLQNCNTLRNLQNLASIKNNICVQSLKTW